MVSGQGVSYDDFLVREFAFAKASANRGLYLLKESFVQECPSGTCFQVFFKFNGLVLVFENDVGYQVYRSSFPGGDHFPFIMSL